MPVTDGVFTDPDEHFFPEGMGEESLAPPATSTGPQVTGSSEMGTTTADEQPELEALPEFDPKHKLPFQGLLHIGALRDSFVWAGHKFTIRTLVTDELLQVALITKRYEGTIGDTRAYTAAMVAAALETADDQVLPLPLEVQSNALEYRFRYITEHWYPAIIDAIYARLLVLEGQVEQVLDALGKANG